MLHYGFAVIQLLLAIWGVLLISDSIYLPCASELLQANHTETVLLTIVVVLQLIDVSSQFFCCYLLKAGRVKKGHGINASMRGSGAANDSGSPGGTHATDSDNLYASDDDDYDDSDDLDDESQQKWERRCSSLCKCTRFFSCGIFGGSNIAQDMEAVAKVLTTFFQHDGFLDVVPSDVMAGILLVRLQQRRTLTRYVSERDLDAAMNNMGNDDDYAALNNSPPIEDARSGNGGSPREASVDVVDIELGTDAENVTFGGRQGQAPTLSASPRQLSITLTERSRQAVAAPRRQMIPTNLDDLEIIRLTTRMSKFAFAIYSHLLYLFDKPLTGGCRLCYSCLGGEGCANNKPVQGYTGGAGSKTDGYTAVPLGDNCCSINHSAVNAVVEEMGDAEVVFASYRNDLEMKPYGIFLDHDTKSIVIAIRGSLSLEDCITDVLCKPSELLEAGKRWGFNGKNRWAHSGMLRSAEAIREDIEREGVLRALIYSAGSDNNNSGIGSGPRIQGTHSSYQSEANSPVSGVRAHPHYNLMVVGHSLGAGAAVLLSLMLRNNYPTLKCCAYGTPGCLVDPITADESRTWLTSVVLNNDIIARAGISTLNHLRGEVLTAITRARTTKTKILRTLIEEVEVSDYLYPKGQEPESEFKTAVDAFLEHMSRKNEDLGRTQELVLPGRIISLAKAGRGEIRRNRGFCGGLISMLSCMCSSLCKTKVYVPEDTTRSAFSEIIVSPSMAMDHFPDRYVDELERLHVKWSIK